MECAMWFRAAVLVGLAAAAGGCGKKGCDRISGRVTLNGKPLEQATVWFWPSSDLKLGTAAVLSKADGTYDLELNKPGCWLNPGTYSVRVVRFVNGKGEVAFPEDYDHPPKSIRNELPERYRVSSPLVVEVVEGVTILPELALTAP